MPTPDELRAQAAALEARATEPDPADATEAAERAFTRNLFAPEAEADDAEPDELDDDTRTTRSLFA